MSSSSTTISSVLRSTQPRSSAPFVYLPSSKRWSRHTSPSFLISFSICVQAAPCQDPWMDGWVGGGQRCACLGAYMRGVTLADLCVDLLCVSLLLFPYT